MATDARISSELPSHPKAKKLVKRLGDGAGWTLIRLFLWAAANRSDGDLSGMTDEDIELAVEWPGEIGLFVRTCADIGFIDGDEFERTIHDWHVHNPWAAGAGKRSQKAKWNAVKRYHGEAEANRQVPEYAAVRAASGAASSNASSSAASNASSTKSDASSNAADAASKENAASSNAPYPSPSPSPLPTPSPSPAPTLFGEEPLSGIPAPPAPLPVVEIECVDGSLYPVTQDDVETWSKAFPAVDIPVTLQRIRVWVLAKPANRKTRRGMPSFITNWLGREQDKGGNQSLPHGSRRPTSHNGLDTKNYSEGITDGFIP